MNASQAMRQRPAKAGQGANSAPTDTKGALDINVIGSSFSLPANRFFTWHEETANLWTHLVPFVWALMRSYDTSVAANADADARVSTIVMHIGAAICFLASTFAHAFGNVVPPEWTSVLWRWDLRGICTLMGASFVPGLRWGFRCRTGARTFYSVAVTALTLGMLVTSGAPFGSRANQIFVRIGVATCAFGLVPFFHWLSFADRADRELLLPSVLSMFVCYLIGFIFWKWTPLERVWPTLVEYHLGSHPVWHCFIFAAVLLWDHACSQMIKRPWDGSDCL